MGWTVSGFDGGDLYVANGDGTRILRKLTESTVAGQDADPAWSPDGHWIAFRRRVVDGSTGGNPEVYLMGADGKGEPKRLTDSPADEQDPSWSRNGGQIAYKSGAMTADWPGKPIGQGLDHAAGRLSEKGAVDRRRRLRADCARLESPVTERLGSGARRSPDTRVPRSRLQGRRIGRA